MPRDRAKYAFEAGNRSLDQSLDGKGSLQNRFFDNLVGWQAKSKITDNKLFGDVFLYEPPFTRVVSNIE
jgi:hypothetical protein